MSTSAIGKNKIITVKSSDRAYGTPSNFGINLGQYNLNPTYCSWHQITIPNGFFNVSSKSNTFQVTVYDSSSNAYPLAVSVTPGNYSTTTLLTNLTTALNNSLVAANGAAPANFFTLAVNNLTGFFTISCSTVNWDFTVNVALASLDWILGFRASQASSVTLVTSATGAAILDLRAVPCIYIRSSLVSGNYLGVAGSESIIAVIQNTALFSQTIFQRSPSADLEIFPVTGQISQVSFQLVDEYGMELTMDTGQEWEISIGLYD